jgi:hypothetical protein
MCNNIRNRKGSSIALLDIEWHIGLLIAVRINWSGGDRSNFQEDTLRHGFSPKDIPAVIELSQDIFDFAVREEKFQELYINCLSAYL